MFKDKRIMLLVTLVLVMSITLTACGGGSNVDLENKDTLVIANGADAPTLDPHKENDNVSAQVTGQIFNRLIHVNEDMEFEPEIATEWENVDDLNWIFKIRQGVKFHNGEELTVNDVKYSLDRHRNSMEVAHILEAVENVEVIDDETIKITTKKPFAALPSHLGHNTVMMLHEETTEKLGDKFGQEPVGTGPYQFKNWNIGDSIELAKFDDYFGEVSTVENMVFKNIPEGTNRTIGLETGEVDIVIEIDPTDKERVEENPDLEYISIPGFGVDYIGFNTKKEPFNDVRVRQAINYAINVDEIVDVVMEGTASVAKGPLAENVVGANNELKGYEYNPEKAKELLAEAGYPEGFKTSLTTNDNGLRVSIAEMVQDQLKQVGIDVDVDQVEWGAYLDKTAAGDHEMFILGWIATTGDADYGLSSRYLSENHGGGGNRMFYTNEKVDELIKGANGEINPEKRIEMYKEAQEIILQDAPDVLLKNNALTFGLQKYVKGFVPHPSGSNDFTKVYFEAE